MIALTRHPVSPGPQPLEVSVLFERKGAELWLRFIVEGEIDRIVWPGPKTPARADELWKHTCFEAFVAGCNGYSEYNLSPSGQWASYRFDAYREGMRKADEIAMVAGIDGGPDYAALEARIELPAGAARLALSAVIEADDGTIGYWALAHPSAKPDFHHPDSFVLDLP